MSIQNTFFGKSLTVAMVAFSVFLFSAVAIPATSVEAQDKAQICEGTGGTLNTTTGVCERGGEATDLFAEGGIFQTVVSVLLFVVGALSVIVLIINAIRFIVSGGDANAVQGARNGILYAIVGVVVAVSAYAIVDFLISKL